MNQRELTVRRPGGQRARRRRRRQNALLRRCFLPATALCLLFAVCVVGFKPDASAQGDKTLAAENTSYRANVLPQTEPNFSLLVPEPITDDQQQPGSVPPVASGSPRASAPDKDSFADEQSRDLDYLTSRNFDHKHDQYIYPSPSRYKLRFETSLGINARTFYERVSHGDLDDFLMEADISLGEVVEIDDGLHPYFFYCLSWSRFVPAPTFDPSIAQK